MNYVSWIFEHEEAVYCAWFTFACFHKPWAEHTKLSEGKAKTEYHNKWAPEKVSSLCKEDMKEAALELKQKILPDTPTNGLVSFVVNSCILIDAS